MSKLQRYQLVEERPTVRDRLRGVLDAVRSHWLGPITSNSQDLSKYWGYTPVSSGVTVNEATALNYSAVWAAVNIISSQVANLPCVLYKKNGRSKTRYDAHPLYRLVHDRPNPEMTAFVYRETLQAHALTWGNNYAEIERNGEGRPAALWPITPDRVTPFRRSADAPLQYRVTQPDGGEIFIAAADMVHVPGLGFDGLCGYSVIAKARESLGLGLATERFGGTFFGNGSTFGGVISYPGARPTELADKNYREHLEGKHQGVDKAHKMLALYNGASYTRMGIPPNDAQFLETRTFQIDEVARWFNLPPHKLKELMRSTNNNIEQQNLEYYIDCLAPWLERWEQELNEKLISPLERNQQEIEFVVDGLLRGDVASRGTFYRERFNTASMTPNDIRAAENQNELAGGDEAYVNTAMIPLSLASDWWQAQIDEKKASTERLKQPPEPPAAGPTQEDLNRALEERDAARKKAQEEEDLRDLALSDLKTAQAVTTELRMQVAMFDADIDTLQKQLVEAREAKVLAEAAQATTEAARVALQADVDKAQDVLKAASGVLKETAIAARDAVVDDLRWLIEHESDRARRVQASPEKLRTWLGQFYAAHEDRCRRILRPSIRVWAICADRQEPVEHVLDLLVGEYLSQSQRQLRTVADESDSETLGFQLEKVLRRWEADRAQTVVDRVLKEVA